MYQLTNLKSENKNQGRMVTYSWKNVSFEIVGNAKNYLMQCKKYIESNKKCGKANNDPTGNQEKLKFEAYLSRKD